MRTHPILLSALAATLFPCASTHAQTSKVLPLAATSTEGNSTCYYPFFYDACRAQVIWESGSVASGAAVISGVNFRRDGSNATAPAINAKHVAALGHTTVSPSAISKTFASNVTSTTTTLFNGNANIPVLPSPNPAPAPFAVAFPLSTPFLYVPAQGNLLLDWTTGTGSATVKGLLALDGVTGSSTGGTGVTRAFGKWGAFSGNDAATWTAAATKLVPGGSADIDVSGLKKNYPSTLIVGLSDTTYGSINLPFDLAWIGGTGNSLYVSMDVLVPFALSQSASTWTAKLSYPLPNDNRLIGFKAFVQSYYADAQANALGLVSSSGIGLTIGSAGPIGNMVATEDAGATSGGTQQILPVIQFTGSIQ